MLGISHFLLTGATVNIVNTSLSVEEGDTGDMTPVQACVMLTNIQSGLMRNLIFRLSLSFETAGIVCIYTQIGNILPLSEEQ